MKREVDFQISSDWSGFMEHKNEVIGELLKSLDFGSSIAESDNLLEEANRVRSEK